MGQGKRRIKGDFWVHPEEPGSAPSLISRVSALSCPNDGKGKPPIRGRENARGIAHICLFCGVSLAP